MKPIILASKSPRRKELLESINFTFVVEVADIDENIDESLPISKAIEKIAADKASAIASRNPNAIVIGADTVVVSNGLIMGKPKDKEEAFQMLKHLSGKNHEVISGVAIFCNDKVTTFSECTKVKMYDLNDNEINDYIEKDSPFDKAGAYGIQGYGKILVESIQGDYFNVVGLPIAKLYRELKKYV